MEKQKGWKKIKYTIVFELIILFFYDAYKFLNTKGSDHPIAGTLFDMIIILAALVFLYHKDEIDEGNKDILGQTYLEKYFKKEKKRLKLWKFIFRFKFII